MTGSVDDPAAPTAAPTPASDVDTGRVDPPRVVPQRLVLVLATTAEYDSRTYRIASTAARRGHDVTVIARLGPGLPTEERHPAGYRIVRVPADPWAAIPGGSLARRLLRRDGRTGASPDGEEGAAVRTSPGTRRGFAARLRSAGRGAIRVAAIGLSVAVQARTARRVDPGADLYHGMAYMGIPVAESLAARRRAPVVYDARDIYVDAGNLARLPGPARRVVGWQERRWARRASRVITVNRPYAEVMASRWGLELPLIVLNCSYRYEPARPRDRRFHRLLGLADETAVVLYQGGLSPDRGIEQLVDAIARIPDAVLVLMGYGRLRAALEDRAADPALGGRVRLAPPVAPGELLDWISAADIVAMPIQPSTLNHRLTTPNKLFEALAAGVPVIASDLPGMAPTVLDAGAGLLVDPTDPAAIADAIRRLLDDPAERAAMAERALAAAHDRYHWEAQADILLAEYSRLTGRPW